MSLQAYAILASTGAACAAAAIDDHAAAQHIQYMQDQHEKVHSSHCRLDQLHHQHHTPIGTDAARTFNASGASNVTGAEVEEDKQDDDTIDHHNSMHSCDNGSSSMDDVVHISEFEFEYDPLQQRVAQSGEAESAGCMVHHHYHAASAEVAAQAGASYQEDDASCGGSDGGFGCELGSKNRPRSAQAGAADSAVTSGVEGDVGNTTPLQMPGAPATVVADTVPASMGLAGHASACRPAGALYYGTDSSTSSSGDERDKKGPSHQPLPLKIPSQQTSLLAV